MEDIGKKVSSSGSVEGARIGSMGGRTLLYEVFALRSYWTRFTGVSSVGLKTCFKLSLGVYFGAVGFKNSNYQPKSMSETDLSEAH